MDNNKPNDPERECLSCEKFFECPHMEAKKSGCINFEKDKKLKERKSRWEIERDL